MKLIRNILFSLAALTVLVGPAVSAHAASTKTTTTKTAKTSHHHKHHHKK